MIGSGNGDEPCEAPVHGGKDHRLAVSAPRFGARGERSRIDAEIGEKTYVAERDLASFDRTDGALARRGVELSCRRELQPSLLRSLDNSLGERIEAHTFVSFLAYCVHVTLRHRLRQHAPGLTPRAVLEKFATLMMLDAWFPTTDNRWLVFARYTQPEKEHKLLLAALGLTLPSQAPPRITAHGKTRRAADLRVVETFGVPSSNNQLLTTLNPIQ